MNLGSLVSETRNPQTMDLDALSAAGAAATALINRIPLKRWQSKRHCPEVAKAVDVADALESRRTHYFHGGGYQ